MPTLHLPQQKLSERAAPVVSGLAEAVIAAEVGRVDLAGYPHVAETGRVLLKRITQMPPHLSVGMLVLVVSFDNYCRVRAGSGVAGMDNTRRQEMLGKWKVSPIGPLRQFVQFYEKMGTFVYYSCVEEERMPAVEVR
ncbi:MAG: hypothetical protein P8R54_18110 [Myxococcota bacterium]|nr:hypothetical protein [Myxococcota bacterium]